MLLLRKIDCYGELILAVPVIITMPFLFNGSFFVGFIFMLCWQVISAAFNTYGFLQTGFEKRILLYWVLCVADLALFYFSYRIAAFSNSLTAQLFFWSSVVGAIVTGAYYWRIYFKLIGFISLRNELDGLTKSKH